MNKQRIIYRSSNKLWAVEEQTLPDMWEATGFYDTEQEAIAALMKYPMCWACDKAVPAEDFHHDHNLCKTCMWLRAERAAWDAKPLSKQRELLEKVRGQVGGRLPKRRGS